MQNKSKQESHNSMTIFEKISQQKIINLPE